MTWGTGGVGSASVETLAKDFRRRLMGREPGYAPLDEGNYTVEDVAKRFAKMLYEDVYLKVHEFTPDADAPETPGLLVAGYDGNRTSAEAWVLQPTTKAAPLVPERIIGSDQAGWIAFAQDEASHRLFHGYDSDLRNKIVAALPPAEWSKIEGFFDEALRLAVMPSMPFADAINFARYLVDTTIGYSRFLLGPNTVGGTVEVAGITRHEGYKWISRKHYYERTLNPEGPRDDY